METLSKAQAAAAIKLLGAPTFNNKRKKFRTWKWYCGSKDARKKLKAAGIPVFAFSERSKLPTWIPESVTLVVPYDLVPTDVPAPKKAKREPWTRPNFKDMPPAAMRRQLLKYVGGATPKQLLRLMKVVYG